MSVVYECEYVGLSCSGDKTPLLYTRKTSAPKQSCLYSDSRRLLWQELLSWELEQFPTGYATQMSSAFVFLLFPFIILKHSCVSNSIRSCRPFHFNTESRRRAELKQRSVQPIILLFWVSGRVWLWVEGCGDLFIHPSRWRKARISHLTHWEAFSETSHNIACAIDSL